MGDFENKYAKLSAANQEKVKDYCRTLKLAEERKAQLAKKTVEKKEPARRNWRARMSDWWWDYGCYVRLAVSALALAVSIFVYFMV